MVSVEPTTLFIFSETCAHMFSLTLTGKTGEVLKIGSFNMYSGRK